uniref:Uncharacterized protein n=3 Tax=Triticinae TaxID=1648030 RepID=A0A452YGN6_AEGTS
ISLLGPSRPLRFLTRAPSAHRKSGDSTSSRCSPAVAAMADRLVLLVLVVAAASLTVASPVAAARPCNTLFISSHSANANPSNDPDHRSPLTTTVVTVFRIRRFGPHFLRTQGHAHPHLNHHHRHHLHSIPANIQIRRPELPELPHSAAGVAASIQERVKDILVVLVGILFGLGCGALTAASMYLVWSVIAGPGASSHYDELYGDEASDSESPKKVGYVIIPGVEAYDGGKN